jgi:nickel-dependent lactate racemase
MIYFARGSKSDNISEGDLKEALQEVFAKLGTRKKVLALPPDFTRFHSRAGDITRLVYDYYGENLKDILPALGTHAPMSEKEIGEMFGDIPRDRFRVHNWRNDVVTIGTVPSSYIKEVSEGKVDYEWSAQVNKMLRDGGHDLILSIGQVVPHEVVGMANHAKNIFVGTGGKEGINKSHFLGAVYGMERMMGRAETPVRKVLNYACNHFLKDYPVLYILTVIGKDDNGCFVIRGLYIGDDEACFNLAASLSLEVNFQLLDRPLKKVVVYLDPSEFKSTWLGNKSIYRTRMAIDDNGELIVLAPGLKEFGEDPEIDKLIRKYGYVGSERVLELTKNNSDLQGNLSAAAHLIHGSSEGRFNITYCTDKISREEILSVNFNHANLHDMMQKYDPQKLTDGWNTVDGEEIFYISNPALGLWAYKERFKD